MKRALVYISLATLMTSCMHQVDNNTPGVTEKDGFVTEITASTVNFSPDIDTRTSIAYDGSFSWNIDDKLGFFPDAANVPSGDPEEQLFYINTTNVNSDPSRARFTANGWGLINGKKYYSYYPHDNGNTYRSVTVRYTGQSQTSNGSTAGLAAYDYLHSSKVIPSDNSEISMEYKHIGAVARFAFSISEECRSLTFNKLTVSSSQDLFRTSGSYNPSADYSLTGSNNRGETVTFTSETMASSFEVSLGSGSGSGFGCDGSGNLVVNAMMSPTSWSGKSITLALDASDGNTYTCSVTPSSNLTAGAMSTLNGTIDIHRDYDVDLSASETANCYIVTAPGIYRFRADIKGNGVSVGNAATTIGTPNCAYVLWESNNTGTPPARGGIVSKVEIKTDENNNHRYIYFTKPDNTTGNAAIVLLDWSPTQNGQYTRNSCFSSNGHTMWLWHIWCPDGTPADDDYGSSKQFMDRNLGALKAGPDKLSMGMLYQWGRPQPFTGASDFNNNTAFAVGVEVHPGISALDYLYVYLPGIPGIPDYGQGPTSISHVLSYPLQFYPGDGNQGGRHWSNEYQTDLWSSNKTMYDPCPPGYKVPSDFNGLQLDGTKTYNTNGAYLHGSDASHSYFWPITGMRGLYNDYTLTNVGTDASYWSSNCRYQTVGSINNYVGYNLNFHAGMLTNNSISYAITGNPVRCQKIQ